jgi:hypothetical protein
MAPVKQPQDRKHKAKSGKLYTFEVDGTTYTLPPASDAVPKMPGRALRDAYMQGEQGQLKLGFSMLEAVVEPDAPVLDALYDMPAGEMLEHVTAWMNHTVESGDVGLGESSS